MSEDRVFDLMVEMVEFAGAHGLARTAQALEGALDAFLQDKGLAPMALPGPDVPGQEGVPDAVAAAVVTATVEAVPQSAVAPAGDAAAAGDAARRAAVAAAIAPDPVLAEAAFRTRRPVTQPRRLHLMPSQRVAV